MCLSYRIKKAPVSFIGARQFFVPCGKCEECRKVVKNSWAFRLRAELEKAIKNKYNTFFWTLTYNDEHLPRLGFDSLSSDYRQTIDSIQKMLCSEPEKLPSSDYVLLRDLQRIVNLPCFSRDDVEGFVHSLREWLWRDYDVKDVFYFGAAEFGSHTQRPHYHFLMSLPSIVDPRRVFERVRMLWYEKGHIFPRYFEGGKDSHGYYHKSFLVTDPMASARYCAKYATKDLYYSEFLANNGLTDKIINLKSREFKRKMVFHVQKRSLGACVLEGLTDSEKINLLQIGASFTGDDKMSRIPVYIKNKLLFDTYYKYEAATISKPEDGKVLGFIPLAEDYNYKRLVRRKANAFFNKNCKAVFDLKVKIYSDLFRSFLDSSNYIQRKISPEFVNYGTAIAGWLSTQCTFNDLASWYLLYDGVPLSRRFRVDSGDYYLLYLLRYSESFNDVDYPLLDDSRINTLLDALGLCIQCYYLNPLSRSEAQCLEDKISDFFKSC